MKKIQMFNRMEEFEKFVNRPDIEIISFDIKAVEQNSLFQEGFAALVYYKELEKIQYRDED